MQYVKPYFDKEKTDAILAVFVTELLAENKVCDIEAVRRYVNARKNAYENAILTGVAEGIYTCTVIKNEVAYKPKPPTAAEIDDVIETAKAKQEEAKKALAIEQALIEAGIADAGEVGKLALDTDGKKTKTVIPDVPTEAQVDIAIKQERAARLSHALNMVALQGKPIKLETEAIQVSLGTEIGDITEKEEVSA